MSERRILFVRSGGGMPGLDIHVGIWQALQHMGIRSTVNSGTSAGAIISAFDSCGWSADGAVEFIGQHDDDSVRHPHLVWQTRLPWLESVHDSDRIRTVLEGALPSEWRCFSKPILAWAARLRDGRCINVARPELCTNPVQAILASMSISGIFPPITMLDGECYIDGGVRFNLPLTTDWRDFDEVYLLIATSRPEDYKRRTGIVTNLLRNAQILAFDQIDDVLQQTMLAPNVHVIWPDVHTDRGMLHFDHRLIDQAYDYTVSQLVEEHFK